MMELKAIREKYHMSQMALAEKAGMSANGVQNAESGITQIRYSTLYKLGLSLYSDLTCEEIQSVSWNGEKLYELRKNSKLRQKQFAEALGVHVNSVSLWENGTEPKAETILQMSQIFGCLPSVFFRYSGSDELLTDVDVRMRKESLDVSGISQTDRVSYLSFLDFAKKQIA